MVVPGAMVVVGGGGGMRMCVSGVGRGEGRNSE